MTKHCLILKVLEIPLLLNLKQLSSVIQATVRLVFQILINISPAVSKVRKNPKNLRRDIGFDAFPLVIAQRISSGGHQALECGYRLLVFYSTESTYLMTRPKLEG